MLYVYSAIGGILWGAFGAYLNFRATRRALEKKDNKLLAASTVSHMVVDIIWLAVVYLLRNHLGYDFMTAIVAAAIALSIGSIVFSFVAVGKIKNTQTEVEPKE